MDTIILREKAKGTAKQFNFEAKNLEACLRDKTLNNLGFWLKTFVDLWPEIYPLLDKVYEVPKLKSNADKKAFLMQCLKHGAPNIDVDGRVIFAKVERGTEKTLITYHVAERFTFKGVYKFIFKPVKKQEVYSTDLVYAKVTEITVNSTSVNRDVIKVADVA